MGTVAYIPDIETAPQLVAWARLVAEDAATEELEYAYDGPEAVADRIRELAPDARCVRIDDPQAANALVEHLHALKADELVTAHVETGDAKKKLHLLRAAPCAAFLALYGARTPDDTKRVLVIVSGGPHDVTAVHCAVRIASRKGGKVTVATIEQDIGAGSEKLGERSLDTILHEVDVEDDDLIERKVVVDNHPVRGVLTCFDDHDLVIVGMDQIEEVRKLEKALGGASVAVVKRTPPLRVRQRATWLPQVNPSDYADLMQQLRQGSKWNADFVMMLGLASAVASLGLMQNSPAVVIGSMLLAPLMTPMIGLGMAALQANERLARSAGKAIGLGCVLTLGISTLLGFLDYGDTLSPEVLARGAPNLLDLGIALFAAIAAGYALARPTIAGAVAGVAIATALVPPVCACGISLANGMQDAFQGGEWHAQAASAAFMNALGAALLFVTNLLAIVLASTLVFSLMGVTVPRTYSRARRTARTGVMAIIGVVVLLCIPLGMVLRMQIEDGRPQPLAYPVSRALAHALLEHVEKDADVRVMFMGRSSVEPLIVIHLATRRTLSKGYIENVRALVRAKVSDPNVDVVVIGVRWSDEGSTSD